MKGLRAGLAAVALLGPLAGAVETATGRTERLLADPVRAKAILVERGRA
ncbi:MAG: hypothetical protein AB7R55_19555 [Gemmatimonadales bacterium]